MTSLKNYFIFCLMMIVFSLNLTAEDKSNESFTVSLSQDPVFGFYPAGYGSIEISKDLAFTFYGIFWTSPASGNPDNHGADLMTEVGVGVSYSMMDGDFVISPSLGIGNGLFQSGAARPLFADNIVPSLGLAFKTGDLSMNLTAVYWKSFRNLTVNTIDMFEYNLVSDYPVYKNFSMGLFVDHLITTEKTANTSRNYTSYFWVGPSFKFNMKNATFWFSSGMDFQDYFADNIEANDKFIKEYYKLSISFGL